MSFFRLFSFLLMTMMFSNALSAEQQKASASVIKNEKSISKPILFEIQLPKAEHTSDGKNQPKAYIFASIHIAKADFYPLPAVVSRAYKLSDTVVVEADISKSELNNDMVKKLSYSAPDKLENHLSPSTWKTLVELTGEVSTQFQPYAATMVAMGLTINVAQQLGYEPRQGLDLYFITLAKKDKKAITELEGVGFQTDVLAALSDAESDAMLASTLETFKKGQVQIELNKIAATWKAGDLKALSKILRDAGNRDIGSQKLMKALIDDRNPVMVEKITKMMREEKKLFVVLGAGHFAGEASILDLLRQRGFSVKAL